MVLNRSKIKSTKKIELLAPAGNFEKLEIAIHYGADAVYLSGKEFSLRNFAENFTIEELKQAVDYAHKCNVKVYVACNIYPRNHEQDAIQGYLGALGLIEPDAVIVADPGTFMTARNFIPHIPVHLSTQANTTNYGSGIFWKSLGAVRVNVARELSLKEIKEISSRCNIEIEAFVHGSMCMSYSGRCLLSSFMSYRDGNRGMCSHPCRWQYAVVEENNPGEFIPLAEDERGSYIFSSRDLSMIEYIPEMIASGIISFKIEGRMKSINYLATTVKIYREAIDTYFEDPEQYKVKTGWLEELDKIGHRGYCTGFYLGEPDRKLRTDDIKKSNVQTFLGKVIQAGKKKGIIIDVRNKIVPGEAVEVLKKKGPALQDIVTEIFDQYGQPLSSARPGTVVTIVLGNDCRKNDLIRKIT